MKRRYSTDLSDAEWECLEAHVAAPNKHGRPRIHGSRIILDAIFYVLKSGCPWRLLEAFGSCLGDSVKNSVGYTRMKPSCTIVLLLALCIFSVSCGPWGVHTEQQKPNILFILTDDQAPSTIRRMPTVQAELASKGLSFENAFVTTPACCPSRATILTGRYAHNHGIFSNNEPRGGEQAFREPGLDQDT
jgi:Putative transposase of IS4/5 family (DUF4096)/Sulfatase